MKWLLTEGSWQKLAVASIALLGIGCFCTEVDSGLEMTQVQLLNPHLTWATWPAAIFWCWEMGLIGITRYGTLPIGLIAAASFIYTKESNEIAVAFIQITLIAMGLLLVGSLLTLFITHHMVFRTIAFVAFSVGVVVGIPRIIAIVDLLPNQQTSPRPTPTPETIRRARVITAIGIGLAFFAFAIDFAVTAPPK